MPWKSSFQALVPCRWACVQGQFIEDLLLQDGGRNKLTCAQNMEHRWIQPWFSLSARLVSFEMPSESICSQCRSQQQRLWEGLTEGKKSEAEITYVQQLPKSKPDVCNIKYSVPTEVCNHVDFAVGRNCIAGFCKSTQWPRNSLTWAIARSLCFSSC